VCLGVNFGEDSGAESEVSMGEAWRGSSSARGEGAEGFLVGGSQIQQGRSFLHIHP